MKNLRKLLLTSVLMLDPFYFFFFKDIVKFRSNPFNILTNVWKFENSWKIRRNVQKSRFLFYLLFEVISLFTFQKSIKFDITILLLLLFSISNDTSDASIKDNSIPRPPFPGALFIDPRIMRHDFFNRCLVWRIPRELDSVIETPLFDVPSRHLFRIIQTVNVSYDLDTSPNKVSQNISKSKRIPAA